MYGSRLALTLIGSVLVATAGCGDGYPPDPGGSMPDASAAAVWEAPPQVPVAVSDAALLRLSPRARERLALVPLDQPVDLLLHLRKEVDHTLPTEAATASFEMGDDGRPTYRLNDLPVDEADLERHSDRTRRALLERANQRNAEAEARADRLVAALGLEAWVVARAADTLVIRARRGELEEVVAGLGDDLALVDMAEPMQPSLTNATNPSGQGALEAVRVIPSAHGNNLRGQGVGIWLQEGNQPKVNDPAISAARLTILTPEPIHSHPTATTATLQRTAPLAHVYYAHQPAACYLPAVVTQQANPPIYVGSHSWFFGEDTASYSGCDAQWDDFVYANRIAMFFSAGNAGNFVGSPGKAYNVFSVGASDHVNGTIANFSGFRNPETGAMKPEIVAPGVSVFVRAPDAFCPNCDNVSGTSISAPIAAGFAADLMTSPYYRNQPQVVKATILAGATTNVEGASLYSAKDGAGQIDFRNTYFNRSGKWWNGPNASYFVNGVITESANLTRGHRARIAISWLTPGAYVLANKRPSMDLTLEVRRGAHVFTSALAGETFQLVDFVVPETGAYTIRIRRTRNSGQGNVLLALSVGRAL